MIFLAWHGARPLAWGPEVSMHLNAKLLEKLYADFARGDIPAVMGACDDKITFQFPGKSRFAGKFTKADFPQKFLALLMEMTGGTLKLDVHDILASDRHAVALATDRFERKGEKFELRTVHVWRFENGKPVAWYEYPRDLYYFDQVMS